MPGRDPETGQFLPSDTPDIETPVLETVVDNPAPPVALPDTSAALDDTGVGLESDLLEPGAVDAEGNTVAKPHSTPVVGQPDIRDEPTLADPNALPATPTPPAEPIPAADQPAVDPAVTAPVEAVTPVVPAVAPVAPAAETRFHGYTPDEARRLIDVGYQAEQRAANAPPAPASPAPAALPVARPAAIAPVPGQPTVTPEQQAAFDAEPENAALAAVIASRVAAETNERLAVQDARFTVQDAQMQRLVTEADARSDESNQVAGVSGLQSWEAENSAVIAQYPHLAVKIRERVQSDVSLEIRKHQEMRAAGYTPQVIDFNREAFSRANALFNNAIADARLVNASNAANRTAVAAANPVVRGGVSPAGVAPAGGRPTEQQLKQNFDTGLREQGYS